MKLRYSSFMLIIALFSLTQAMKENKISIEQCLAKKHFQYDKTKRYDNQHYLDLCRLKLNSVKGLSQLEDKDSIVDLNLSYNALKTLNVQKILKTLPHLQILQAANNNITRVKLPAQLPDGFCLNLTANQLNNEQDLVHTQGKCCYLYLSNNKFNQEQKEKIRDAFLEKSTFFQEYKRKKGWIIAGTTLLLASQVLFNCTESYYDDVCTSVLIGLINIASPLVSLQERKEQRNGLEL